MHIDKEQHISTETMAPRMNLANALPHQHEGQCQLPETAHGIEHCYSLGF